ITTYLSVKDKGVGETFKEAREKGKESKWYENKVLWALLVAVLGGIIGQKALKNLLKGLNLEELQELLDRGEDIPEEMQRQMEEQAARLEELERKAEGVVGVSGAIEGGREMVTEGIEIVSEASKFEGQCEALLAVYCFNEYRYDPRRDKNKIKKVFEDLREERVIDIIALWEDHKTEDEEGTIPRNTDLYNFGGDIDPKHIYTACWIISQTFDQYKRHLGATNYSSLTLDQFFGEHLAQDPVYKIHSSVQTTITAALEDGDLEDMSLEGIAASIEDDKNEFLMKLAKDLNLTGYSDLSREQKIDFGNIALKLYRDANLDETPDRAMRNIDRSQHFDESFDLAKRFYEAVRENTLNPETGIISRCVDRFNLGPDVVPRLSNADIIKNELSEEIEFGKAVQLNIVAQRIDFSKSPQEGSDPMTELALLYVVLNSITPSGKRRYLSELSNYVLQKPVNINLPSLELIRPYLKTLLDFGIDVGANKIRAGKDWISAYTADRTPEEQEAFLREIRTSNIIEFGAETGKEAGLGTIRIGADVMETIWQSGRVAKEDLQSVETTGDFLALLWAVGGSLIISKNPDEQHTGVIYLFGKYFYVKPLGILRDTLTAWAVGDETGKTSPSVCGAKVYLATTSPFVVIGTAHGYYRNRMIGRTGWRLIGGALEGTARGLAAPITLPVTGTSWIYRAGRAGKETVQTGFNWTWDAAKYKARPARNINIMMRDAQFVKRYFQIRPIESTGVYEEMQRAWAQGPRATAQRLAMPYWNQRMLEKYAIKFNRRYNSYFGKYVSTDITTLSRLPGMPIPASELKSVFHAAQRTELFFQRLINHPEYKHATTPTKIAELIEEVGTTKPKHKGETTLLSTQERSHLIKKVTTENKLHGISAEQNVRNFRSMIHDARGNIFLEAEVAAKVPKGATAVLSAEGAIMKPVEIRKGVYNYLGEEFTFRQDQIDAEARRLGGDQGKAIEKLCHQEWSKPRKIGESAKGRTYRYRGAEFTLTEAEYTGKNATEIKAACEAKFIESVQITDARTINGKTQFKVGETWVELAQDPKSIEHVKTQYLDQLKQAGKPIEYVGRNPALLEYMPVMERVFGSAVAALILYHLETAEDKRKAIFECTVGLGTFMAGAAATEKALSVWKPKTIKGFLGKKGLVLLGGLGTAIGVTEPISDILDDLWPHFIGEQQLYTEIIDIVEKSTGRSFVRTGFSLAERKIVRTGVERMGLKSLSSLMTRKVESTALKKIATFTSKSLMRKLAVSLGVKGTTIALLIADDATWIGVLDDIVAVGMAVWMAKDIYDIAVLARKALKIKVALEDYNEMPIASIEPSTEVDRNAIEAELAVRGKTLEEMTDEEMMEMIQSMPDIRLKITREGATGYEEYRFVRGEIWSTTIKNEAGEIYELSDEELNQEISVSPPEEFRPWEIDYNLAEDDLLANYRLAIMYTKSECAWTKMDHEFTDTNNVVIKRLDGNAQLNLTRTGETWAIEGFKSGLDFFQAIALANLINKVNVILENEKHVGANPHPFELQGIHIDFDRNWNPVDLRIISGKGEWAKFYEKIGISNQELVDVLNAWYAAERIIA
ncbi:hypothetical protein KKF04_04005, partial [Patescibacteria group bacterium]|nr:hypothetical protein [Patescibacteria group bacterium]